MVMESPGNVELAALEADLGPIVSRHERRVLRLLGLAAGSLFAATLTIALAVAAFHQRKTSDALMAGAISALFAGVAVYFPRALWRAMHTRIDIAERGFVYSSRAETRAIRWAEIGGGEAVFLNGRIRTVVLHVNGERIMVLDDLARFDSIVAALERHGVSFRRPE